MPKLKDTENHIYYSELIIVTIWKYLFLVFFRDLKLTKYAVFFNSSIEEHWLSMKSFSSFFQT